MGRGLTNQRARRRAAARFQQRQSRAATTRLAGWESLEGRICLAADPFYAADPQGPGGNWLLRVETPSLEKLITLVDARTNQTLAAIPANQVNAPLVIVGSAQTDVLTIELDLDATATLLPSGILFNAGAGRDELRGPAQDTNWFVNARGLGQLGNAGTVRFAEVESLIGHADNQDQFTVAGAARWTGSVDGGSGGHDTLVVTGSFQSVRSKASGPQSGSVDLDSHVVDYAGLEPIQILGSVAELIIVGSPANDNLLIDDDPAAGQMSVSSVGTMETVIFPVPTQSLTIDAGAGDDRIQILGHDTTLNAHVQVLGGDGSDRLEVKANAELDAGGGSILLASERIALEPGSAVRTTGNVELIAQASLGSLALPDTSPLPAVSALLSIDGATIAGHDLLLSTAAQLVSAVSNLPGTVLAPLNATLLAEIMTTGPTSLQATGKVTATSLSNTNATITATARPVATAEVALATPRVQTTARTRLGGSTSVSAAGTVAVESDTVTILNTTATGVAGLTVVGTTVAAPVVTTVSEALVVDTATVAQSAELRLDAQSLSNIATTALSTPAGASLNPPTLANLGLATPTGPMTAAAAVAAPTYQPTTRSAITSTGLLRSTGAVQVRSAARHQLGTTADASPTVSLVNNGAAAATNILQIADEAFIGGPGLTVTIDAPEVEVATRTDGAPSQASVTARSGAAGINNANTLIVSGLQPGAVAITTNVPPTAAATCPFNPNRSDAYIADGTTLTLTGGNARLSIDADNSFTVDTSAEPAGVATIGGALGVGRSAATNLTAHATRAAVGLNPHDPTSALGVVITGADELEVLAHSDLLNRTTAYAGALAVGAADAVTAAAAVGIQIADARISSGSSVQATGPVTVQAERQGATITRARSDAAASALGGGSATATPLALNLADDRAMATVSGTLQTTHDVLISSHTDVNNQSESLAGATGASLTGTSAADIVADEIAFLQQRANFVFGSPLTPVVTQPVIGTADGQVGDAAALAVDISATTTQAAVVGAANLNLGAGELTVEALSDARGRALANASSVNNVSGKGVSAALSVLAPNTLASVAGSVQAAGVDVQAETREPAGAALEATSFSGAGNTDVGVAGALAGTLLRGTTQAVIDDGADIDVTNNGNVFVSADTKLTHQTNAQSGLSLGTLVGVGGAIELNGGTFDTLATVRAADIDGAQDLSVMATGDFISTPSATPGAVAGSAFPAALAMSLHNLNTRARVEQNAGTSTISGDLLVQADHRVTAQQDATTVSVGQDVGLGAAVAIGVNQGGALALNNHRIDVAGSVDVLADSRIRLQSHSTAGQAGADGAGPNVPALTNQQLTRMVQFMGGTGLDPAVQTLLTRARAATADGAVGSAAALAANYDFGHTLSAVGPAAVVSSGGPATIRTRTDAQYQSLADASQVNTEIGVGVAAAVNLISPTTQASLAGSVTAPAVAVESLLSGNETTELTARAISGTGSDGSVGVAGAFAMNSSVDLSPNPLTLPAPALPTNIPCAAMLPIPTVPVVVLPLSGGGRHEALVVDGASVTLTQNGDLHVEAAFDADYLADTRTTAVVPAGEPTDNTAGVGASVSVNGIQQLTQAAVGQATIQGAHNLVVNALGHHDLRADADAGATGNTSLPGAVAMNYSGAATQSLIETGAQAGVVSGSVVVEATHTVDMQHTAETVGAGNAAGVGAAFTLGVAQGGAQATSGLSADVAQSLLVQAYQDATLQANSVTGQQGVSGDADSVLVTERTEQQAEALLQAAGLPELPENLLHVLRVASAETADGPVGAAAAVAVNVDDSTSRAGIIGGTLTVPSEPFVRATADREVTALADASSVGTAASLGVAVAVNADSQEVDAFLGGHLTAPSFSVSTSTPAEGDQLVARAYSGTGSSDVGVAGAFAANVSDPYHPARHAARIADGAVLTISNDGNADNDRVLISAQLTTANLAEATAQKPGSATVGVGPSVALNAASHDAVAEIGNAQIVGAKRVTVRAEGAHTPTTQSTAGANNHGAFPAAIALTGQANNAWARLLPADVASHVQGDLIVTAQQTAIGNTVADAQLFASGTGLGLALAGGGMLGGGQAVAGPQMIVDGDVTITAHTTSRNNTASSSFSAGPKLGQRSIDHEIREQLLRLAELTGVDAYLFPEFDANPSLSALIHPTHDVDAAADTLRISPAHRFTTGDSVVYHNNFDDTSIGTLVDGSSYFVSVDPVDLSLIQLHATRAQALSRTNPMALTPVSAAEDRHTLTAERIVNPAVAVDVPTHTLDVGNFAGLESGDAVRYFHGDGADIGGLADGGLYYVHVDDDDPNHVRLRFFTDRQAAQQADKFIPIDLSGTDGSTHRIVRVMNGYASRRVSLDAVTGVDTETNQLSVTRLAGLETGDAVVYRSYGQPELGQLDDDHRYFVRIELPAEGTPGQPLISLHPTRQDALDDKNRLTLDSVDQADLVHELIPAQTFDPLFTVDNATATVDVSSLAGLEDGDAVVYRADGESIGGLVDGGVYYVVHEYQNDGRAWFFESADAAEKVIAAKERPASSSGPEGAAKKAELVLSAAVKHRIPMTEPDATGEHHQLERVDLLNQPDARWMPKSQFGASAALAVGAAVPVAVAAVGDGGQIQAAGDLTITSLLDFRMDSTAAALAVTGIGASLAGNYSSAVQRALIGDGAQVTANSVSLMAAGTDNLPYRYDAQARGGAVGRGANLAGSLAVNALRNEVTAAIQPDAQVTSSSDVLVLANVRAQEVVVDGVPTVQIVDSGGATTQSKAGNIAAGVYAADVSAAGNITLAGDIVVSRIAPGAVVHSTDSVYLQAESNHALQQTGNQTPFTPPLGFAFSGSVGGAFTRTATNVVADVQGTVQSTSGHLSLLADGTGTRNSTSVSLVPALLTAVAGSAVSNTNRNRTAATISGGAAVDVLNGVTALARDNSTLTADSRGLSSALVASVSAAYSHNLSASEVVAGIDGPTTTVHTVHGVTTTAEARPVITTESLAVGAAGIAAVGGALSVSETQNQVQAGVSGGATVESDSIQIQATTDSNPTTHVGAAQGSRLATINLLTAQSVVADSARAEATGHIVTQELTVHANSKRSADSDIEFAQFAAVEAEIGLEAEVTGGLTEVIVGPNADLRVTGGPVVLSAHSDDDVATHLVDVGLVEGITLGGMGSLAEAGSSTEASLSGKVRSRALDVSATADKTVEARNTVVGATIIGLDGVILPKLVSKIPALPVPLALNLDTEAVAIVQGDVSATVATGADIVTTQAMSAQANSHHDVDAHMARGGVNVFDLSSLTSQAYVLGATSLVFEEGVRVQAQTLTTRADAENEATSRITMAGIQGVGVDLIEPTAITNHDVTARIGPVANQARNEALSSDIQVAAGDISLEAHSINRAHVPQVDVSIAGVSGERIRPTASVRGSTRAVVGGQLSSQDTVRAVAESTNEARSHAVDVEVEAVDVSVDRQSITTRHTTEAIVSPQAHLQLSKDLELRAEAHNSAIQEQVTAFDVAGVDVEVVKSWADAGGATNAYVDRGSQIEADRVHVEANGTNSARWKGFALDIAGVDVQVLKPSVVVSHAALAGAGAVPQVAQQFNPAEVVNDADNRLAIPAFGLVTGDRVEYFAGKAGDEDAKPVGGLTDGQAYYVSVTQQRGETWVQLHHNQQNALTGAGAINLSLGSTTGSAHRLVRANTLGADAPGSIQAAQGLDLHAVSTNEAQLDQTGIVIGAVTVGVLKPEVTTGGSTEVSLGAQYSVQGPVHGLAESSNTAKSDAVTVEIAGVDVDVPSKATSVDHATHATIRGNAHWTTSQAMEIEAVSVNDAGSEEVAVDVSGVSVDVAHVTTQVRGSTKTAVLAGAQVQSPGLVLHANAVNRANAKMIAAGVGGVVVDVIEAKGTIQHFTESYVGTPVGQAAAASPVILNISGPGLDLRAQSDNDADAITRGGAVGAITASEMTPIANIQGATRAHISGSVNVDAAAVNVRATADNTANATPLLVGVGAITGQGAYPQARIGHQIESYVGTFAGDQANASHLTSIVSLGEINVSANGSMLAEAETDGGSGGAISIAAMLPKSEVTGQVKSYVREDAWIDANRLTVAAGDPTEPALMVADSQAHVVTVAAIAGSGVRANSDVTGTVESFVGRPAGIDAVVVPGSGIKLRNAARVDARSAMRSQSKVAGGTGGGVAVSVMLPTAHHAGVTRAFLGDQAHITANSIDVAATSLANLAKAEGDFVSVAVAEGSGADVVADLASEVAAYADGAILDSNTGVNFAANSRDNLAEAVALLRSGGLLSISKVLSHAKNRHETRAELDRTNVTKSSSVDVVANSKDRSVGESRVKGGGVIRGAGTHAVTEVRSRTLATLGRNVNITAVGDVNVSAQADTAEGDSQAESRGGGGIAVGTSYAELTVAPEVTAAINGQGKAGDPVSNIIHAGDVHVRAELRREAIGPQLSDHFHQQNDVNLSDDTITFAQHGLDTGDIVTYSRDGQPALPSPGVAGQLEELREYSIIRRSADQLQLGTVFAGQSTNSLNPTLTFPIESGVDPLADVIVTASPHNLQTGDAVKYDSGAGASISAQLTDVDQDPTSLSTTYYVRRIDDYRFKLATSLAAAQAAATEFSIAEGLVSAGNTLNLPAHGFQNGDRVTYRGAQIRTFRSVNVDLIVANDGSVPEDADKADANNIHLGFNQIGDGAIEPHGLATGSKLTYRVSDPSRAIGGLSDGQDYYVIATTPYTIQLAASLCEATGCSDTPITPLNLEPNKNDELLDGENVAAADVVHALVPDTLGALQHGVTYTVANATANSLQLENNGAVVSLEVGDAFGVHSLGIEGIELTPDASTSEHTVRIDLAGPTANVSNSLLGPLAGDPPVGTSLRTLSPPTGDGESSASAKGGNKGGLAVDIPTADANLRPNVQAFINADLVEATGTVSVHSDSLSAISGYSNSKAGGVIKVGQTLADVDVATSTQAFIGRPADGVTLAEVEGDTADPVVIAPGVTIRAKHFALTTESGVRSEATASAKGGGLIASSRATTRNDVDQLNNTILGRGANVDAETVKILTEVDHVDVFTTSEATAGGGTGRALADGDADITSRANLLLEGGSPSTTRLTGKRGVDLRIDHNPVKSIRSRSAQFKGLGKAKLEGANETSVDSLIDADARTLVTAGPRILAGPGVPAADVTPLATPNTGGVTRLALLVDIDSPDDDLGDADLRTIQWDADAEILSGPSPELEIDDVGRIIKAINISVDGGKRSGFVAGPTIVVDDVINDDPGEVLFRTNDLGDHTLITHTADDPQFKFRYSFDQVSITNHSDFILSVRNIDPFNRTERPLVVLSSMDEAVPLEFDIRYAWEPTRIVIQQLTDAVSQLRVVGEINNPLGRTELVSQNLPANNDGELPSLLVGANSGLVRTNDLDIVTTRGGYSVNAQLVQSAGRPTHYRSKVNVASSSYLRVQGVLRDPDVDDFVVQLDSIETWGSMHIDYLKSIREVTPVFQQLLTEIHEVPLPQTTFAAFHFHPVGEGVVLSQLPLGAFATGAEVIDSTYDFESIVAEYLLIEPGDEPCPGIETGFIVDWEQPGPSVVFDGPDSLTLHDVDGDGLARDLVISGLVTLTERGRTRVTSDHQSFLASRQPLDSVVVNRGGQLHQVAAATDVLLANTLQIQGTLGVVVGSGSSPIRSHSVKLGVGSGIQATADERFDVAGRHRQVVLVADEVDGAFRQGPTVGEHLGRGLFAADFDGDGQSIRRERGVCDRTGLSLDLYQASPGDIDGNGHVDSLDLLSFISGFGRQHASWTDGDFDGDQDVDSADLLDLISNFGRTLPSPRANANDVDEVMLHADCCTLKPTVSRVI